MPDYKDLKTIINCFLFGRSVSKDNYFMHYKDYKTVIGANNVLNIYRGCTHGCIYCDSRSKCYNFSHNFEDIEIKNNCVEILTRQLRTKKTKCMISTGAMCDPYMPIEKELQLTRQCIEVVAKFGFGLSVLTKSSLVERDIDLFLRINNNSKAIVQMTLTTFDENLCKKLEPNVATTVDRYKVLKKMQQASIPTVVWLGPILPFINDSVDNLQGVLDYCIDAGVYGILFFGAGVTMREGSREHFYNALDSDKLFRGVKKQFADYYGLKYSCISPNSNALKKLLIDTCNKNHILCEPKLVWDYITRYDTRSEQLSFI